MEKGGAERFEGAVDAGAAALLAAAIGFAAVKLTLSANFAAAAAALAFLGCFRVMRGVAVEDRRFELADFPVVELDLEEVGDPASGVDELILDDVLAEPERDSGVVRLFDPAAMATAGQLKARTDRHLCENGPPSAPPDASQALHEALAELRRSLR